jgi:hypothetical protein
MTGRTTRFRTRLGTRAGKLPEAALDDVLSIVVERGEQRLAHRPVARDAFVDHVADALARADDAVELDAIEQLAAPDLYLACALAAGDTRALEIADPSTAFRWIRDVEQRLAAETRTALMEKLSLSESQVRNMERLVASQLHISLTRMLRAERAAKKEWGRAATDEPGVAPAHGSVTDYRLVGEHTRC